MNKLFYNFLLFASIAHVHSAVQQANLQKIAYAVDEFDLEGVKTILAALSADERTNLLHKKICVVQGVGFLQRRTHIILQRTLEEQINSMLQVGQMSLNVKLYLIEVLLRECAL